MKHLLYLCLLAVSSLIPSIGFGRDFYVSPTGDDANIGTRDKPLATLAAARDAVREFAGKESVTVHVAQGVYYLPETLAFTPEDSGTADHPIAYRAEKEGASVLSGGLLLNLKWQEYKDGIYSAKTPDGLVIDQLFVDVSNQRMARYPNFDGTKKAEPYQGFAADAFSKKRAANWADPTGGYIHAMHRAGWGGYHYQITGKEADGDVTYEGGWQNNRRMGMHKNHRMVENIFEELDAPGEWFHDAKTSTLYYMPAANVDLTNAKVEVVRLRHLIEFQGTESSPLRHISLQGFTVRHAARTFMDCKEQMLRSDWAIYRGGAFMLTGTEDVSILDCEFDQVGGNAIFVNNYNRRTLVKGCHIHDCGASGVCFVGDPDAVRNPLFEYGQKNDLATIDRTPGPKTNNYPADCSVDDCLIHGIGRVERQPAGVQIEMAAEISVSDCSVYDTARAGINIGDGAWGGHLIDRCDVFDTVLETHDHGSFNSWGRDRYWRNDLKTTQEAVDAEPNLPFLDAMKTTIIRNSRWRCDHGWDIDLDDGSSNYDIYNNLLLNKGLKLREGFRRHAWNNVMPAGWFHPHVWFQSSNDRVYANIFVKRHSPARMSQKYVRGETMVDRNLFTQVDERTLAFSKRLGWDSNSVMGDAMYVDPTKGDFRVKEGSPAMKLGFKNFPMDQFGVKKPSLKAIARTPEIPELDNTIDPTRSQPPSEVVQRWAWEGAVLQDLKGEEFSAYGASKEAGGVAVVRVAKGSAAEKAGMRAGDLIQGIGGQSVSNAKAFFQGLKKSADNPNQSVKVMALRSQKPIAITLARGTRLVIESAKTPDGLKQLTPVKTTHKIFVSSKTANQPLSRLTDGELTADYGPIFPNDVANGTYKMDLGESKSIAAINSWSFNKNGIRGEQNLTIYASNAVKDPGWKLSQFTPIGTIATGGVKTDFTAASIQSTSDQPLGRYRWIVWSVSPVTKSSQFENTAFQELSVTTTDEDK